MYCLAFNADGSRLVSGGFDNLVKMWDPDSAQEILALRGHIFAVTSVEFSPDNSWIASGNDDGTVRLWIGGEPAAPQGRFPP